MNPKVLAWVREAPFSDTEKMRLRPNFDYEDWFERGRALPQSIDTLVQILEQEDPEHPSGDGMRVAYALGWIGNGSRREIEALLRSLHSKDLPLRMEAAAALGRLRDASVLPVLEKLLRDKKEDPNIRANACIAIGRLGIPSSEGVLREALKDTNPFIVRSAEEALRLLVIGGRSDGPHIP